MLRPEEVLDAVRSGVYRVRITADEAWARLLILPILSWD
jgi:hypothetical protein